MGKPNLCSSFVKKTHIKIHGNLNEVTTENEFYIIFIRGPNNSIF